MATSNLAANKSIEQDIEDAIRRRTGRRIAKLNVQTSPDCVLVRGSAPSYYVEQLALRGVWDVIGRTSTMEVVFELEVPIFD
jgi:hypothetical protein